MVRSGTPDALIVVGLLAVSLVVLVSPPPETAALLVTLDAALLDTFTVRVKAAVADAASVVPLLLVQVNVPSVHVQPVGPVRAVAVKPLGKVSVTVIVAVVIAMPLLVAVNV